MTEAALDEAARVLARRVGLRLDPAVRGRLSRAVHDEARRRGENATDYVAQLDRDPVALQDLLNRVTVQETSFFRDPGQFWAFANVVLPALRAAGGGVRVWSAGCANGQEAYSLAIVLAESGLTNWQVIATDISTKALARTAAARYTERELAGLSPERRARHLVPVDGIPGTWEMAPALRKGVLGLRHNLAADRPPVAAAGCQTVFCRNVLIYFGRHDVVGFLNRLSDWLPTGGHLFLGYSESLWLVSERFHLVRLGDAFVYRNGPAAHLSAANPLVQEVKSRPAPSSPRGLTSQSQSQAQSQSQSQSHLLPRHGSEGGPPGLMAVGEAAMGAQDYPGAVTAFRRAAYLDPDQPVAYLSLGLALEALGDLAASQRAFAAARASIGRCDTAATETTLEGYRMDDFARLLDRKAGTA
ncbi:MAG: chemotaxis protein methyltransferase CheR [Actinomycetota bacterium]|nr:chemotaxis protein methyltransferase CheR [Actinomycetota bacterium]